MAPSLLSRLASAFPAHLFRRITSGGALLAELDGLREVAAAVRTRSLAALAPLFEGPATSSRRSAMPRSGSGG
jgi:hypothetical protein